MKKFFSEVTLRVITRTSVKQTDMKPLKGFQEIAEHKKSFN